MVGLNKIMLWVVTAVAIVFLLFPNYVGFLIGGTGQSPVTSDMNVSVIKIEGMTCEGCSALVVESVRKVPGVVAVEVDHKTGQGIVGIEGGRSVLEKEILKAVEEAGFKGALVEIKTTPRPIEP